jgi:hypothetical protein
VWGFRVEVRVALGLPSVWCAEVRYHTSHMGRLGGGGGGSPAYCHVCCGHGARGGAGGQEVKAEPWRRSRHLAPCCVWHVVWASCEGGPGGRGSLACCQYCRVGEGPRGRGGKGMHQYTCLASQQWQHV